MSLETGTTFNEKFDHKTSNPPIDAKTQRKTQNDHVNGKRGGATKK
jgi:hypothetical protein